EASDAAGNNLLAASNELNLSAEGFKERAAVTVDFNADLPRPDVFLPELSGVGAINLQGSLKAGAEGEELTLSHADLLLSASDVDVVSVKLNKSFTLGGNQDLSGNLMDFRVTNLPLAWLALWLPEGASLSGNALSAEFNLTGLPGGALQFSSTAPLQLGPLSFSQDGVALLNEISILAQPVVRYRSDGSVSWSINEFQIQDRYGEILTGQSEGSFNQSAPTAALLPAGLKTQTTLNLGLQQITQQPALSGYTSIFSGRAKLELMVDPSQAHPVQALGRLDGISPRAYPGQRQNYRFELKLSEPRSGALALDAILQAGSESNPSSTLELTGQVIPGVEPLEFKTDLIAQRMSQGDIEMLKAAFLPEAEAAPPVPNRPSLIPPVASTPKPTPPPAISPAGPPWAGYDGELTVSIGELYLLSGEVLTGLKARAVVSEPLLRLSDLEASLLDGNIAGSFEARYSKGQRMAYALKTDLKFDKIDPAVFAMKRKDIPVKGLFAGQARFEGQGAKFEDAVDAIQGELVLTGRDGVLTAFDLDSLLSDFLPGRLGRMRLGSLGLLGASVLGDQLDRPGIRALAEAIPYFENMPFTDFTLKLTRGADQRVIVPQLEFVGRNLLIQGSGSIAATQLRDILNQPMDLALELGAKGQLIDSLETLELLQPDSSEDGFRRWKDEIQIKGSLGDPDTSALERVLRQAANRALRESKKEEEETPDTAETAVAPQAEEEAAVPTEQVPEEKLSKEERILRDVGTGLDILFGR
ncbi:MAG: AsmA-like C-terminal region-containing protein, partial [Opitutales bacterium]